MMLLFLQLDLTVSLDRKSPEKLWYCRDSELTYLSLTSLGIKNKDGVDIKDCWKDGVHTYLGMQVSGFPNMFMVYSPQGKSPSTPSHTTPTNISQHQLPSPTAPQSLKLKSISSSMPSSNWRRRKPRQLNHKRRQRRHGPRLLKLETRQHCSH